MTDHATQPTTPHIAANGPAAATDAPMVSLERVFKVYDMGATEVAALDGVDLNMERGEFISVIGASGSGKSTLLHLVGCLDTATAGSYRLEGHDITRLSDRALSRIRNRHFGFVFQSYNLLPEMTALENVEQPYIYAGVAPKERRNRASRQLDLVGLGDRLHHYPTQLSGGQQQRVAIARALANEPTLLLADEPTGNLNTDHGNAVLDIFQDLHQRGMSIMLVTHDRHIAELAPRTIELKDGRVIRDEAQRPTSPPATGA